MNRLSRAAALPILKGSIQGRIQYGTNLLIEFAPDSIWYETSFTIAAGALRDGLKTEYHTFERNPNEIRNALTNLGLNAKKLEEEGALRIKDSYTTQLGLRVTEETQSVKLADMSLTQSRLLKEGYAEEQKGWLHIDDNLSVLNRYNSENAIVDWLRTRGIPDTKASGSLWIFSLLTGVASESFYRQCESLSDGIIDFEGKETEGRMEQRVRVRLLRGKPFDSSWRKIRLLDTGEVTLSQ